MRQVLEQCIEMDTLAHETYSALADSCKDEDLRSTLATLAEDEKTHMGWWEDLLGAWESGLLPDVLNEPARLADEMAARVGDMRAVVPEDLSALSEVETVALAAKLEFFMLDPIFPELIDLVEPASATSRHEAYGRHLERLAAEIEKRHDADPVTGFLARVLRRVWADQRMLSSYSTRDPLTGLFNRRSVAAHLRQWTAWSARYGHALGVLLVDVDDLKSVNDQYGPEAGDRTLLAVADALGFSVRSSDMVARYGADEFVVIAPEADVEQVGILAQRIVEVVRGMKVPVEDGRTFSVTVSVGSAVFAGPAGGKAVSFEQLLSAADQALYAAKQDEGDRASTPAIVTAD